MSEISIFIIFATLALVASLLFQELNGRADDLVDKNAAKNSSEEHNISMGLEEWRRHYYLACTFVDKINSCFGWILLIQTVLGFSLPILDFYKISFTQGLVLRYNLEFCHTTSRFFLFLLIPSFLITKKV